MSVCPRVFAWARSVHPTQPLTSGVWKGNWSEPKLESEAVKTQLGEFDVISYYKWPERFEERITELRPLSCLILCTEYMARGNGSTFDTVLPIAKREHVAAMQGASQPSTLGQCVACPTRDSSDRTVNDSIGPSPLCIVQASD